MTFSACTEDSGPSAVESREANGQGQGLYFLVARPSQNKQQINFNLIFCELIRQKAILIKNYQIKSIQIKHGNVTNGALVAT